MPDFTKSPEGLIPVIVQDANTYNVLMLGYMDEAAYKMTGAEGRVTFYSRSKRRLWTKGEESGNYLRVIGQSLDCDRDSLLIMALPEGPVCHTGRATCFTDTNEPAGFLSRLEAIIAERRSDDPATSYVAGLFEKGVEKMAQKVGEEAVELVIEAMCERKENFREEAADLLFHYLILLSAKGFSLPEIVKVLEMRHNNRVR